ncbi:MAG TPA: type 1 glutamine amidotransferase [Candidatus Methanoperedenaceae archaeon]|nr:type 1 glutamine amidotransferase [Candidatus Methanoperedenaceae archaeon]
MRLHSIEHEPFEGLANIKAWAIKKGHSISRTLIYNNEELPGMDSFDWLFIMGGSMNIYEEDKYPWLKAEKNFIADAIASDKIVLGVCLGSQLIADVLGGKVSKNKYREIGWFPVKLTKEAGSSPVFGSLPQQFNAFHWHGDTFDIPPGAARIAESEACANQAFELGRVIGLQFHLEYSAKSIGLMLENCGHEIIEGTCVQTPIEIISEKNSMQQIESLLSLLLDNIEREFGEPSQHYG